jgi:hypothetical protein
MRRTIGFAIALALAIASIAAAPAAASERRAITITAVTLFASDPDAFTSTGLGAACADGTVVDGPVHFEFRQGTNVYAGYKVFTCDATTGFVLRLNARFGGWGSTGTWAVADAWGALAGIQGAGPITGSPLDNGILDNYSGTITD